MTSARKRGQQYGLLDIKMLSERLELPGSTVQRLVQDVIPSLETFTGTAVFSPEEDVAVQYCNWWEDLLSNIPKVGTCSFEVTAAAASGARRKVASYR